MSLADIFFIVLAIFRVYNIIYRKTQKVKKKKKRCYRDEKMALKNRNDR